MVRNIAGAIFEVLKGKRNIKELENMLNLKSKYVYTTAQAKGLSLIKVNY
jgi:tRNA U38,U39,U40 pseudouridine synthase TruA